MRNRAGFTLIELLVVMAVIMVLGGLLFPAFAPAKAKGRQVNCLNNLRQLGMAMALYCGDNDGAYPPGNWVPRMQLPDPNFTVKKGALWQYVASEKIFICVDDSKGTINRLSYEMNELLFGQLDTCAETGASTVLLLDAGVDNGAFQVGNAPMDELIPVHDEQHKATDIPNPMNAIHLDKACVLYIDGHTSVVQYKQLTAGDFHPENEE